MHSFRQFKTKYIHLKRFWNFGFYMRILNPSYLRLSFAQKADARSKIFAFSYFCCNLCNSFLYYSQFRLYPGSLHWLQYSPLLWSSLLSTLLCSIFISFALLSVCSNALIYYSPFCSALLLHMYFLKVTPSTYFYS